MAFWAVGINGIDSFADHLPACGHRLSNHPFHLCAAYFLSFAVVFGMLLTYLDSTPRNDSRCVLLTEIANRGTTIIQWQYREEVK